MKALTIHQPFAQYIADGVKQYETRGWSTDYRGLVAIHSGKKWDRDLRETSEELSQHYSDLPDVGDSPILGAILAIALLETVVPTKSIRDTIDQTERAVGGYADGRYAWKLRIIERFDTPIPASGQQGLWQWDWDGVDTSKRIAVVGSRDYPDLSLVKDYIYSLSSDTVIISGGAQGVDLAAETHARERGMKVISIPVDARNLPQHYERRRQEYGRRAKIRNQYIVEMAGPVVAFWDESSRGTKDSINKAKKLGRDVIINPLTKAIQPQLVQQQLAGFLSVYDEGAYIEKSNTKEESSATVELFEWVKPWLINEHWVWLWRWVDGEREYYPARIDSEEAKRQQRVLTGILQYSELIELRDWLEKQSGWENVPYEVIDVGDMASGYFLRQGATKECVPLENVAFTQERYNVSIAMSYYRSLKITDEDGKLPYAARFGDSERVYIFDGTHRTLAHIWSGRDTMVAEVNTYPESFERACGYLELEDADLNTIEVAEQLILEALAILQGDRIYA